MKDKQLKKLSRQELLELLLEQTRTVEKLEAELAEKNAALENKRIITESSGSLAEAVIGLNGVMEAAQKAAEQYLENMELMKKETEDECKELLEKARAEAERIVSEAENK